MNPAVVMQPVITMEFVAVMVVPVTMDGTSNQIVQVIQASKGLLILIYVFVSVMIV